jgi:hypothetical protein
LRARGCRAGARLRQNVTRSNTLLRLIFANPPRYKLRTLYSPIQAHINCCRPYLFSNKLLLFLLLISNLNKLILIPLILISWRGLAYGLLGSPFICFTHHNISPLLREQLVLELKMGVGRRELLQWLPSSFCRLCSTPLYLNMPDTSLYSCFEHLLW